MASHSYILDHDASASDSDELDSLPSISSSVLDSEPDSDAQAEWERSLEQMQLLLTMILVPFAGKYFGRKFAYWSECPREPHVFPLPPADALCFPGWGRYMEWMHNVEIKWTNKKKFNTVGAIEAAATL